MKETRKRKLDVGWLADFLFFVSLLLAALLFLAVARAIGEETKVDHQKINAVEPIGPGATSSPPADIGQASTMALTEVESLKINAAAKDRLILFLQIQQVVRQHREMKDELRRLNEEHARLVATIAKAHGVDLKTHELDAKGKAFVEKSKEGATK